MVYTYRTSGVCSREISIEVHEQDRTIGKVSFVGGCNGNLKGVSALVEGQKIDDVIDRLSGIKCGFKQTSCPDQLSRALKEISDAI